MWSESLSGRGTFLITHPVLPQERSKKLADSVSVWARLSKHWSSNFIRFNLTWHGPLQLLQSSANVGDKRESIRRGWCIRFGTLQLWLHCSGNRIRRIWKVKAITNKENWPGPCNQYVPQSKECHDKDLLLQQHPSSWSSHTWHQDRGSL